VKPPTALLCVGNLTVDDAVLPGGLERRGALGGDAVYAGLAARLFEPRTRILAPLGSDLPAQLAQALEASGVGLESWPRRTGPTIRNTVTYAADGSRRWRTWQSQAEFEDLSIWPADLDADALAAPAALVTAMALRPQAETVRALARGRANSVYLDLQEDYIRGNESQVRQMTAWSFVFLPSEEEARQLSDQRDLAAAARQFSSWGPKAVVIKRGALGSLVYDSQSGQTRDVPACRVEAVDTTGAGDAFCGGFAATHRLTGDLVTAAQAGAVAASFAISDFGVDGLLRATPAEAWRRLAESASHGR
jgi:ribokinase